MLSVCTLSDIMHPFARATTEPPASTCCGMSSSYGADQPLFNYGLDYTSLCMTLGSNADLMQASYTSTELVYEPSSYTSSDDAMMCDDASSSSSSSRPSTPSGSGRAKKQRAARRGPFPVSILNEANRIKRAYWRRSRSPEGPTPPVLRRSLTHPSVSRRCGETPSLEEARAVILCGDDPEADWEDGRERREATRTIMRSQRDAKLRTLLAESEAGRRAVDTRRRRLAVRQSSAAERDLKREECELQQRAQDASISALSERFATL
ncbi:hypothetical protein BKA62DRAFT_332114 [Auriculariales sp. MPI-PUGE-AT-0066]|nr:hypothetical protein BKA62DRAFT_332114 [Auriculariales sp. MPI-PUGE-AT-0066]